MFALVLLAAATAEEDSPYVGPIFIGLGVGIAVLVTSLYYGRKARRSAEAAAGVAENALVFNLSPAPLLVETIAKLRALYGVPARMPRVARTTRPAVTVTAVELTITEGKLGTLISIPAADIVSIAAGTSKATFAAPKYPSVLIGVRHADTEILLALPPLLGGTQPIKPPMAQQLASEISARLGFTAVR